MRLSAAVVQTGFLNVCYGTGLGEAGHDALKCERADNTVTENEWGNFFARMGNVKYGAWIPQAVQLIAFSGQHSAHSAS